LKNVVYNAYPRWTTISPIKTRWQNRQATKKLNHIFNTLKVDRHADKTVENRVLHDRRLNEQQKKATPEEMAFILDRYVNRWQRWVSTAAGLGLISLQETSNIEIRRCQE
jgi:hypothetical protein